MSSAFILRLAALLLLLPPSACLRHTPRDGKDQPVLTPAQGSNPNPGGVAFVGACDASGAVSLSDSTFVVADDEDNVLRVYDADRGGPPTASFDMSPFLALAAGGKARKRPPETDIEAATRIGDRAYFVTSHARSGSGKLRRERLRFFATTAPDDGQLQPIGQPYDRLLDDLLADPRLERYGLSAAARRPPKAPGGLNLEGMTARVEGGVWIGFRNPIPEGRALLVPLLNPEDLIAGRVARWGEPVTLDLGGLGVRGLSSWRGRYLIAAGSFDGGLSAKLLAWDGRSQSTAVIASEELSQYNPEGFFTPEARDRILLLSDEGTRRIGSVECKRLKDPTKKSFRGLWLTPPSGKAG